MRFIAIALFLFAIPVIQTWLRQDPRNQRYVGIAIGMMPFAIGLCHLDASIISWPLWPGYVKGMIVSLIDTTAIAVLLAVPGRGGRTPFVGLLIAYLLAAALAIAFADLKQAAFFYPWQLARMLVVFLAVARLATRPDGARHILTGMMIGAIVEAGFSINERLHGVAQAGGTFGHQNLLGMALHFGAYPAFALLLAGRRDKLILMGVIASIIGVGLTGSRATLGLAAGGLLLTMVLSMTLRPSGRKSGIAAIGLAAMLAMAPLAYNSLSARLSADAMASSDLERDAFKRAAWFMIDDHPMGVGGNQYVVKANSGGYSARAGVAWNPSNRAANVHDTYLLAAAETGYLGGLAFILLMTVPIVVGLRFTWSMRNDPRSELALGLSVALTVVAAHCLYEWIYVTYPIQYLHGICLGLLAGLIRQCRLERKSGRAGRQRPALAGQLQPAAVLPRDVPQPYPSR